MAYAIIYTAQIKDKLDSITYKVDILQDGYGGGSSTITYMSPDPVRLKYRSAKGKDVYVIGSSLTFKFKSLPADNNKYDALFEGEEKEFKIKYYKGAVLIWEGYIQSDNLQRTYLDELYTITLNATDWLSNLKDVEFRDGDTAFANEVEVLQVIKTCLGFTGIELDFYTQINTYETTYMTSTTDVLNNLFINQSRFTSSKDGKTKYTSVYNVLVETLKPLNLTLKQVGGRYHLVNVYEVDSFYRVHAWVDLSAGSRTATDHIIDIDDSIFETQNNLAKLKPELRLDIKRFANDTGGELIGDLDDFSGGGPWTINAPDGETHSADRINITDNDPENNGSYIRVTSSSQTGLPGRYMSIEFDSSFIDTTWYLPLRLGVKVTKPSSGASTFQTFADPETGHFQSPITDMFELNETGVYIIEINVSPNQKPGLAGILTFQNVRVNAIVIDDTEFDRNYIGYIDQNGQVKEDELYFSDADTNTDKGGYKAYSSGYVRTLAWNRYGKTDGLAIQEIYTLNILKNRQDYKNFISINVIDNSFAINASSIIQIDSINHKIIEITTIYKKNIQELKIERIFESDPSYTFTTSTLTSISGESTDPYNPIGSGTDHGTLSGLSGDDHTQYHNDTRGDARYYTKALGDAKYAILAAENTFTEAMILDGSTTALDVAGGRIRSCEVIYGNNRLALASYKFGSVVDSDIEFHTANGTAVAEKMRLLGSGELRLRTRRAWDTNGMSFEISTGATYWLMENDGDFHAEGDVIAFSTSVSDRRLKENIKPLESALDKILKINGVEFDYINNKSGRHIGIIAQDLKEIIPEVVIKKKLPLKTDSNKLWYVIRYTELIPYIIEGIKELSLKVSVLINNFGILVRKIDKTTARANENDNEIKRLKYEINLLKKEVYK